MPVLLLLKQKERTGARAVIYVQLERRETVEQLICFEGGKKGSTRELHGAAVKSPGADQVLQQGCCVFPALDLL